MAWAKCEGDEMIYKQIREELKDLKDVMRLSSLRQGVGRPEYFEAALILAKPKNVLEIGTCNGVATALLAKYADTVCTIDIVDKPAKTEVWKRLGVADKIVSLIIKEDKEKIPICEEFDFDFAFIDGGHTYEQAKFDFECTKKCGRLLFHDYGNEFRIHQEHPGVNKLVDELQGWRKRIRNIYAYVESI